ncbi:MAG: hypothetical protein AB7V42_15515 [Thermoleophilia bacterium]
MPTLYLRNVPPEIDATLAAEAKARGISKNRRAIEALKRGLGMDHAERIRLVEEIRAHRPKIDVDVAELIRRERPGGDDL